jgi:hypothetical protein
MLGRHYVFDRSHKRLFQRDNLSNSIGYDKILNGLRLDVRVHAPSGVLLPSRWSKGIGRPGKDEIDIQLPFQTVLISDTRTTRLIEKVNAELLERGTPCRIINNDPIGHLQLVHRDTTLKKITQKPSLGKAIGQ